MKRHGHLYLTDTQGVKKHRKYTEKNQKHAGKSFHM